MTNPTVRRSSAMVFKCDMCGKTFEGDGAEDQYQLHLSTTHNDASEIPVELIRNPEIIQCVVGDIGDPNAVVRLAGDVEGDKTDGQKVIIIPREETHKQQVSGKSEPQSLNDLLGEIHKVPQDFETVDQYACPVCKRRAKVLGEQLQWIFNSVEDLDQHLWTIHKLMVKRDGEFSVEDTISGKKLA